MRHHLVLLCKKCKGENGGGVVGLEGGFKDLKILTRHLTQF